MEKFKLGDGLRDGTTLGPLISAKAVDFVQGHVDDAVQKGAKVGVSSDQLGHQHWYEM